MILLGKLTRTEISVSVGRNSISTTDAGELILNLCFIPKFRKADG
jgi:hypothetical protein